METRPQLHRQRDEPLLRTVVEVALEPPALGVAGLDDPRARSLQLLQASAQLDLQAAVLERQRGRRRDGVEQLGLIVQRRIMHQRRDIAPPCDR